MALYSYGRLTDKSKNFRTFYIALRKALQQYYYNAKPGYLIGNWSEEARAFNKIVEQYNPNQNDATSIIELRDKTRDFANSLQSTYHWVTSTFIGSWAADLISTPVGGGGSTLKQSLEKVLIEFEDLFTAAEQAIERAKELEAARQKAIVMHDAASDAATTYHTLLAQARKHRY